MATDLHLLSNDEYLIKFSVLTLLDDIKRALLKKKPRDPKAFIGQMFGTYSDAPTGSASHASVSSPAAAVPAEEEHASSSADHSDTEDNAAAGAGGAEARAVVPVSSPLSMHAWTPSRVGFDKLYSRDIFYQLFSTVSRKLKSQILSADSDSNAEVTFMTEVSRMSNQSKQAYILDMFRMLRCFQKLLSITSSIPLFIQRDKAVENILNAAYEMISAEKVLLWLVDDEEDRLVMFCNQSADHDIVLPMNRGILGHVIRSKHYVNIPDVRFDQRFDAAIDNVLNLRMNNVLYSPVIDCADSVVAVLQVINKSGRDLCFTSDDVALLECASFVAAYTLENARLYKRIQRAERKSASLLKLFKQTERRKGNTLADLVNRIIDVSYEIFNADRVTLFMIDQVKKELWFARAKNINPSLRIPITSGIAGFVARTGKSVNAWDVYNRCEFFDPSVDQITGYVTHSVLCYPVVDMYGAPIALIQLINKVDDFSKGFTRFNKDDEQLLEVFCVEVGKILQMYPSEVLLNQVIDPGALSYIEIFTKDAMVPKEHRDSHPTPIDTTPVASVGALVPASPLSTDKSRISGSAAAVVSEIAREEVTDAARSGDLSTPWDTVVFNAFKHTSDELVAMCEQMFVASGLVEEFSIPMDTLHTFLLEVRDGYNANPFHNWYHAFSVFQYTYYIWMHSDVCKVLSRVYVLGMLVAAISHDLGHTGVTNDFLVRTESVLALTYNDVSVLENHHSCKSINILRKRATDIFVNCTADQRKKLKHIIVRSILGTDMEIHFTYVEFLNDMNKQERELKADKDFQTLVNLIVHAADLSNQCYDFELSRRWGSNVFDEFESQANKESEIGLDVPPFRQGLNVYRQRVQMQLGFIDYVLASFWKGLATFFPVLQPAHENLVQNRIKYAALLEQLKAQEQMQLEAAAPAPAAA